MIKAAMFLLYFVQWWYFLESSKAAILGALSIFRVSFLEFLAIRVVRFAMMFDGTADTFYFLSDLGAI